MIKIIHINNSFEPRVNREIKEVTWEGKKLYEYLPPSQNLVVMVNQIIVEDYDMILHDGSEVIISYKQETGAIAGAIYGLFVSGGAEALAAATISTMTAGMMLSYVAAAAVMMAGSMLLSSVLAPSVPNYEYDSVESSPTYSWSTAKTRPKVGSPIPVLYGTHQLAGNIIQRRIEYIGDDEYLYLQLVMCMGEVETINDGDVQVNNTEIALYDDVELHTTQGTITQDVLPYFGDIESPNSFSQEFTDTLPVIRQTIGNTAEALRLFLQFPSGLYYQNTKGGLDSRTVDFTVEYKKTSDVDWITLQQNDKRFDHWEYEYEPETIYEGN